MRRSYANIWSALATWLTAISHTGAAWFRWSVVFALTAIWIGGGLAYWLPETHRFDEALYRTLSAVGMWDRYFDVSDPLPQAVRFAALAAPAVSLLFAFSGQLGRSLARISNLGAAHHIVIAGESPAALSLAYNCRERDDAVILIAKDLPNDTALDLRRKGVIVLEGEATLANTLKAARAAHAAHVVAFTPDDTRNLQIEAAVRGLVGNRRRRPPIGVHVATHSPLLLRESREMRKMQMAAREGDVPPIDPKPFSLAELAARRLLQGEAQTLLTLQQPRVHLVFFGFDANAEAVAERVLMSLWSAEFEAPRLTVLAPNPEAAEASFKARHSHAFAHPEIWSADIAFLAFDWNAGAVNEKLLDAVEAARGKPTAAIVSTGGDPENIHLSIALRRTCNHNLRWPIPIFMKESARSEFSQQYARGDTTEELDAYLQAFGGHETTATRAKIIDGALDKGAGVAHTHYVKNLGAHDAMTMKELQAATRDWGGVLETYRAANRAVADSAMVKLWDAGWAPVVGRGAKGETQPEITPDVLMRCAEREHARWNAERLMSGWRPAGEGETRDNAMMIHDKIAPWSAMTEDDRAKDAVQVRAAVDIARMLHPQGFVRRQAPPAPSRADSGV